ncbi:MAG: TetR/AcrR family transcriptional regulator [Clostridia bacterium]|nr:TetR/AcrR family transcriptional regulator [Clostridia bacterium]
MPKIIENVRELLLATAKEQVRLQGYAKTTIRSVAGACGLGVGTVYNYFPSKDMLIATFVWEDWRDCLQEMKSQPSSDATAVLNGMYVSLQRFIQKHQALFADKDAAKVFATVFSERHKQLRDQLAAIILPVCEHSRVENKAFLAEFLAESLLTWVVEGKPFSEPAAIFRLLLQ